MLLPPWKVPPACVGGNARECRRAPNDADADRSSDLRRLPSGPSACESSCTAIYAQFGRVRGCAAP